MRVKGAAADIGGVDNFLNRDILVAFLLQQAAEGFKDRVAGFDLPPVHGPPFGTDDANCSISDIRDLFDS